VNVDLLGHDAWKKFQISSPKWWLFMVMNSMGSQSVKNHLKQHIQAKVFKENKVVVKKNGSLCHGL